MENECMKPKYRRVLLKLSGEAMADGGEGILNFDFMGRICTQIKECSELGVQFGIVVGAGNIWRGRGGKCRNRSRSDAMGMLATVINSLALQDELEASGQKAVVLSAKQIPGVAEIYSRDLAVDYLERGYTVIIAGGTGNPFFSTDTAGLLRAAEIDADITFLAKNIDGVYTADPKKDSNAVRLKEVTYDYILKNDLKVIDLAAAGFGRENAQKVLLFGLQEPENIKSAVMGEDIGTVVY
ncbi:MAG: UMP kinase [Eubacteriales bacterium]|nr:UMP kinase [Eubacteriales bacterium]